MTSAADGYDTISNYTTSGLDYVSSQWKDVRKTRNVFRKMTKEESQRLFHETKEYVYTAYGDLTAKSQEMYDQMIPAGIKDELTQLTE